ncbi:MAG TPA: thiamine pyrophosphate-dependent enzyme [Candidatus Limnocylindria bacterium]|nr:thiamine pyrophosphate-dependent enzyme [Candidatus Limnocylindria bacterium]
MLTRPEGLRMIAERFPDDPVVLTLGGTLREMLAVAGRRPNHLPILDAMGQPAAIGLGLALGVQDRYERVVVVEGDGSLLMGLSSIATIGHLAPQRLILVVFDNGVYLATGGQPTAAADVDYVAVATACGWAGGRDIGPEAAALAEALDWAATEPGPVLIRVRVGTETIKTDYFLEDPVVLGRTFMDWLEPWEADA